MRLVADGLGNREIAELLSLSENMILNTTIRNMNFEP
jgi:DNA-binding CsgD family transcriptional regulator